jgi:hypothetical protein
MQLAAIESEVLGVAGWGGACAPDCAAAVRGSTVNTNASAMMRAPRHRDHLFHAIMITHSTAS